MSHVLRQSTQVVVRIGPFMDSVDAVTPETGITLAAADQAEALKAAGAATADISGNTWAAITGAGGWYDLTLTTTDTNTIGDLTIVVQDTSVCLPVFARFQVVEEAAYDTIYAASALPASTTNITAGTITTTTNLTNLPTIPANWLTAAGTDSTFGAEIATAIWTDITAGDFTVASSIGKSIMNGIGLGTGLTVNAVTTVNGLAANVITAAATASDFGTEVAAAVWDMDATAHQTQGTFGQAIGDPVADTGTIFKATVTDATGVTVGTDTATLLTRLGTPSDLGGGATVAANLSDIEGQTDDIGAAGVGLTALATQASVTAIKTKTDFLPSATAGSAGGVFIAGTNAATTVNITGTIDTVTTAVNVTTVNGLAANVITATAIATDAIGADEFAQGAADKVWGTAARILTAGTNIVLAKGVGVTGFNDITAASVWTVAVDGATTAAESMRLHNSALGAKLSGGGTGTEVFRDIADTKDRITATVDSGGNRTAIVRDLT